MDILKQSNAILPTMYEPKKYQMVESWDDLIQELYRVFEADSVNVEYIHEIMSNYKSNPKDWKKYAKFDRHRYTRNLVDVGNGKFNLMVLAWGEGHGSSIHDHADSHCFMKMLDGCLTEVRYGWPKEEGDAMTPIGDIHLKTNDVAYINDSLGLHRVENRSHSETAVSLHLYCPPFDACQMFDQRTGHKTVAKVTFWSKFGERSPHVVTGAGEIKEHYENN